MRILLLAVAAVTASALVSCADESTEGEQRPEGEQAVVNVNAATLPRVGAVDERYQSYNVEMLEVTGGDFWKPYGATPSTTRPTDRPDSVPEGMDPGMYLYRPPIDLTNPRLRTLAAALGPAYVRVSGTWANTTYFADTGHPPSQPPPGFNNVLTREQWRGVVDFAQAVNAEIATSFAISPGTRDAQAVWTPDLARRWVEYTRSVGGEIAAAAYMNEPNAAAMGGAPPGYHAADYGRDFKISADFAQQAASQMTILGPGSVGETPEHPLVYGAEGIVRTTDLLTAAGPGVDAFTYHHYGAASQRCAPMPQTTPEEALTEDWLGRTSQTRAYYGGLRDQFEPGKPTWLTEVADAACGGNPWASTFLDSFRYLDQLGRLATEGVQVVAHNTLVASDYGLLDDTDLTPKPNYWAALLWHRLMGQTVLDSGVPIRQGQHLYAHCQPGTPGGVSLLAINNDRTAAQTVELSMPAQRYTLDAAQLDDRTVRLNGQPLTLGPNDTLPTLTGMPSAAGPQTLPPGTITFFTVPTAGNPDCP